MGRRRFPRRDHPRSNRSRDGRISPERSDRAPSTCGARAGCCARARRRASRHQAVEFVAGRSGHALDAQGRGFRNRKSARCSANGSTSKKRRAFRNAFRIRDANAQRRKCRSVHAALWSARAVQQKIRNDRSLDRRLRARIGARRNRKREARVRRRRARTILCGVERSSESPDPEKKRGFDARRSGASFFCARLPSIRNAVIRPPENFGMR